MISSGEEQGLDVFLHKWSTSWVQVEECESECSEKVIHSETEAKSREFMIHRSGIKLKETKQSQQKKPDTECEQFACVAKRNFSNDSFPIFAPQESGLYTLILDKRSNETGQGHSAPTDLTLVGRSRARSNLHEYFEVNFKLKASIPTFLESMPLQVELPFATTNLRLSTSESLCFQWKPINKLHGINCPWSQLSLGEYNPEKERNRNEEFFRDDALFLKETGAAPHPIGSFSVFSFHRKLSWREAFRVCKARKRSLPLLFNTVKLNRLVREGLAKVRDLHHLHIGLYDSVSSTVLKGFEILWKKLL